MASPPIRTFSYHYRTEFGFPVGKIPLDLGAVCPNREKGGCIFCRPASFAPGYLQQPDDIAQQVLKGKTELLRGRFKKYFAYFQQETSTSLAKEMILPLFQTVLDHEDCVGIILSTRPDYIDDELVGELAEVLSASGKRCLFELGLQSVHDASLDLLNRNHTFEDFKRALGTIRKANCFQIGAHLIFGIPGETEEDMLTSIDEVSGLGVDALKLHHLQVIRDTPLQQMYDDGRVHTFSLDNYLRFLLRALPRIPGNVVIHRLWATAHPQLLIAPKWNILATELSRSLLKSMKEKGIYQGQACKPLQ